MNFVFHPEAEFMHAIDYYEAAETGLGYDFAIPVHFQRITPLQAVLSVKVFN